MAEFGQAVGVGVELYEAFQDAITRAIRERASQWEPSIADRLETDGSNMIGLVEVEDERWAAAFAGYVALHCDGREWKGTDFRDPDDTTKDYRGVRWDFVRDHLAAMIAKDAPIWAVRAEVFHHETDREAVPGRWIFLGWWGPPAKE